jgi:hypothetical protein
MKSSLIKSAFYILVLCSSEFTINGQDSFKIIPSMSFYQDLSDSYGGGHLLDMEIKIKKTWFGASSSFGQFQSCAKYVLKVPVPEINGTLNIPFDEITIMKIFSISGLIEPVKRDFIQVDMLIGACYNSAQTLQFNGAEYLYDTTKQQFTYLVKDYQLRKDKHFGYQIELSISLFPFKKIGFDLKSRVQDLNNKGSFFFVGGGLCFKS